MPDSKALMRALKRGVAVHEWCEAWDAGSAPTIESLPTSIGHYCSQYLAACRTLSPSFTHAEVPFDASGVHGVIDRVGVIGGSPESNTCMILEIKTGSGSGRIAQLRTATQLAAYALAWGEIQGIDHLTILRVALFLTEKDWRTVVYSRPQDFTRWRSLLAAAQEGSHGYTKISSETRARPDRQALAPHGAAASADDCDEVRSHDGVRVDPADPRRAEGDH